MLAISLSIFTQISQFLKESYLAIITYNVFFLANVGNQLKLGPNAMIADDTFMQQCAAAHYACKMLTCETSELIGPDISKICR